MLHVISCSEVEAWLQVRIGVAHVEVLCLHMLLPTLPFSTRLVSMTISRVFCPHTILQKSSSVLTKGPEQAK